jgi:hypothetical protein
MTERAVPQHPRAPLRSTRARGSEPIRLASATKRAFIVFVAFSPVAACSSGGEHFTPPSLVSHEDSGPPPSVDASVNETPPPPPCSPEGIIETCGQIIVRVGNYETCSTGHRVCQNGVWGECVGDHFVTVLVEAGAD